MRDRPNSAAAVKAMPRASGTRGPNREVSAPATGDATMNTPVIGSIRTPASTGLMPCTCCRYRVMKKIVPNIAKKPSTMRPVAADSDTERNSPSGSSGRSTRSSFQTNPANSTTDAANDTSGTVSSNPFSPALMSPRRGRTARR